MIFLYRRIGIVFLKKNGFVRSFAIAISIHSVEKVANRAFVSTHPLVHKHVKISVDEWIMETTRPHKQVQIPKKQFFCLTLLGMIISHLHFI